MYNGRTQRRALSYNGEETQPRLKPNGAAQSTTFYTYIPQLQIIHIISLGID